MGGLLSALRGGKIPDIFIDFENAQPTAGEKAIFGEVQAVHDRGPQVLDLIDGYKGCQELARKAMSQPTPENEQEAFEGLLGVVDQIACFFNYAKDFERILPILLKHLASQPSGDSKEALEGMQATCKQLAQTLNFALQFDGVRMMRPSLSNDFSYYRRLLPKFSKHPDLKVKDDEASGMALFTAEHIPMMSSLTKSASRALENNEHVTLVLSTMANACLNMLKQKKFANDATNVFTARAMTGAIVLFDHVDDMGAFHKRSPVAIKQCVLILKKQFPNERGLLSAIQYSTKHFKDDSTPSNIQDLFD